MRQLLTASLALGGLALLVAVQPAATASVNAAAVGGEAPAIGEVLDYKFRTPPMNANGATELADFRGRPLLIEFWGTR